MLNELPYKKIYAKLTQENLDGLIISSPANISYLTNFTSRDSYFLISKKTNIYITDSRYAQEAKKGLKGLALITKFNGSVFKIIADACIELGLKRIGFEERYLAFAEYKKIEEELNKKGDLIPTYGLVEELRQIKTAEELEKIKKATQITIKAFKFIKDFISPGKKEIEVAAELGRYIRYCGGRSSAFDIIVASGPNSSFPHHLTSQRKIKDNEPVLVDLGADYMGYKSDLTRVFFLGKISPAVKRIYDIVCKAQARAIKEIKPAVHINKIDAAARQYITQKGYGGFFGHNLGHGIGLEVHEEPHISSKENKELKAGMIFTVEPGIYLPDKFGIRLEDIVLVTKKGYEVISGALDK
ncbi:MAG: Xaa-Pro dipeptidase [Candidatus Omnitrophica bacterium CG23_combo_of_CG06-09_8_20_14_all_40_11]|nr:MAG: Xaa-Pro dipeptidase [Candidatus Omnitrophica bacterium CG23_combo_of_CG06-09_8_20_14_all_40_11]